MRSHGAANEHWLPCQLVINRYERVVWRKGARAALPVHQQRLLFATHHVLLNLSRACPTS